MRGSRAKYLCVGGTQLALDADKAHVVGLKQRLKLRQRQRAVAVVDVGGAAGPGQRDVRRRHAIETRSPFRDQRFRRVQIRNVRWNIGQFGLAGERQARQRAVHVERRQRLAARDDAATPSRPASSPLQLRLHLQHHAGAGARQQRRIAREHHRIAEALLGVQQDGLARERGFAEPQRLPQILPRAHAGALPAPLVFRQSARIVADRQTATAPR